MDQPLLLPPKVRQSPVPLSVSSQELLKVVITSTGFRGLQLKQTGTFIRETGGGAA
jgi:hypothetical protein